MRKLIGLSIIISCLISCSNNNDRTTTTNYLNQPTGNYGIGFKDYYYINPNICPDINYTESNQRYFSPNNPNHCHEVVLRVYYPTIKTNSISTTKYYPPFVSQIQQLIISLDPEISLAQTQSLTSLISYTQINAPTINQQFPVILLSPAYSTPAEGYENTITQLVSNGYIVVGINSVFINGDIELADGIVVPYIQTDNASLVFNQFYNVELKDLLFVYQLLQNSSTNPITTGMDLTNIATVGHSIGAMAALTASTNNPTWFKAVMPLDGDFNQESKPLPVAQNPILYQFSSQIITTLTDTQSVPSLNTNNSYQVVIAPNDGNESYTLQNNFPDYSTLQYQPVMSNFFNYLLAKYGTALLVGNGNGQAITNAINTYSLQFFNTFLKNQPNIFISNNCSALTTNSYIKCGNN